MSRDDGTGACIAVTDYMHYAIINTSPFLSGRVQLIIMSKIIMSKL